MSGTPDKSEQSRRIVVGIDGSKPSRAALEWAAKQAALTAAPLSIVMTWAYPTNYGLMAGWPDDVDFAADAKSMLNEAIEEVLGPDPAVSVTSTVVQGHPSVTLVDESKTAALVVVGSRGHGEFAGMLIGSVSEFVAMHAFCPVVIIRDNVETPRAP